MAGGTRLDLPSGVEAWRLEATGTGTLEGLALVEAPEALRELAAGEVRIAVRAAGVNFRDVLFTLGLYPGTIVMGGEVAGVVAEVGPGVAHLAPGDRVMGICTGGFGPFAVTDARCVCPHAGRLDLGAGARPCRSPS